MTFFLSKKTGDPLFQIINMKSSALAGLLLIAAVTIIMMVYHIVWWAFIPVFFMFMEAFCELASVYLKKFSPIASEKLQTCAFVFGVLTVLGIIGVFIAWQIIIP